MNLALAPHFHQRTAEAIKCRRKHPNYRRLVADLEALTRLGAKANAVRPSSNPITSAFSRKRNVLEIHSCCRRPPRYGTRWKLFWFDALNPELLVFTKTRVGRAKLRLS
ncbi:hypothetical protein Avbf_09284 [Armadillidium vulgare]|nr:hypothetical protein Avbf_09284 [Armadillidium vulgare]